MKSLDYGRKNKGMKLYAYCVMTSHMHMMFWAASGNPSDLLRDFKTYTSKRLQEEIVNNHQESRREWMVWMMERSGEKNSNVKNRQFWQQQNKPIELWSSEVMDQKLDYIHQNPVEAGFVNEPQHWRYSSALTSRSAVMSNEYEI